MKALEEWTFAIYTFQVYITPEKCLNKIQNTFQKKWRNKQIERFQRTLQKEMQKTKQQEYRQ